MFLVSFLKLALSARHAQQRLVYLDAQLLEFCCDSRMELGEKSLPLRNVQAFSIISDVLIVVLSLELSAGQKRPMSSAARFGGIWVLQRRLAWPTGPSREFNSQVLELAGAVVRKTWDYHWGDSSFPKTSSLTAGEKRSL